MRMTSITLSDGSVIAGVESTGSMFYSPVTLDFEGMKRKLRVVKIEETEEDGRVSVRELHNARLGKVQELSGIRGVRPGYYFSIEEPTELERRFEELESKMEYASMMLDLEVEGE